MCDTPSPNRKRQKTEDSDCKMRASSPILEKISQEFICPCCLEILVQATTLVPCGHSFCNACVFSSRQNQFESCPTCRQEIENTVSNRAVNTVLESMTKQDGYYFSQDDIQTYEERVKNSRPEKKFNSNRVTAPRNVSNVMMYADRLRRELERRIANPEFFDDNPHRRDDDQRRRLGMLRHRLARFQRHFQAEERRETAEWENLDRQLSQPGDLPITFRHQMEINRQRFVAADVRHDAQLQQIEIQMQQQVETADSQAIQTQIQDLRHRISTYRSVRDARYQQAQLQAQGRATETRSVRIEAFIAGHGRTRTPSTPPRRTRSTAALAAGPRHRPSSSHDDHPRIQLQRHSSSTPPPNLRHIVNPYLVRTRQQAHNERLHRRQRMMIRSHPSRTAGLSAENAISIDD